MRPSLHQRVIGLVAALLVAAVSLLSASAMAPAKMDRPDAAAYLAVAGSLADLCGGQDTQDRHDCPFCRLLADPPHVGPRSGPSGLPWPQSRPDSPT